MTTVNYTHLTPQQVAERLQISVRLLEKWRHRRTGPRFVKVGHLVRYPIEDVEQWLTANTIG